MIRAVIYRAATGLEIGGLELIDRWRAADDAMLWLDIEGESEAVERPLLERFDIHPLAIQDALRKRHPPKIEEFDNFLFVLLRGLDAQTTTIDFGVIQLSIFVGERWCVTRHDKPSVSANAVFESLDAGTLSGGAGALALRLANRLQRRYVDILLALEPRLDGVEQEMFARPDDRQLAELTGYKSKLRQLARIAAYHESVVGNLRKLDNPLMPALLEHELTDLYEQVERSRSLADLYYQVAADLMDSYLALSSHRLNAVMQVLTIITVIFVPLTFIAGIYGMNFENMPELRSSWGYFAVIGIMLVIAVLQLALFRRKRWL